MSTGQWLIAPEGISWFFDAGADSLDFAAAPEPVHARDLGEWLAPPPVSILRPANQGIHPLDMHSHRCLISTMLGIHRRPQLPQISGYPFNLRQTVQCRLA